VTLNRMPYTIIGVAPKTFTGVFLGGGPALWLPMAKNLVIRPEWYETRRGLFLNGVARLKPGVTVEQARSNLRTVFANLEQAFPVDNKGAAPRRAAAAGAAQSERTGSERARAAVHGADDRGRHRAADCVREHREPAAVARDEAAPRSGDPARTRREAITTVRSC